MKNLLFTLLTLVLGFGYLFFGIMLVSLSGPIIWGALMIVTYFIYRFFKLQEDYFYFTVCIFILYFISNGDASFIGGNILYIFFPILFLYLIPLSLREKKKKDSK